MFHLAITLLYGFVNSSILVNLWLIYEMTLAILTLLLYCIHWFHPVLFFFFSVPWHFAFLSFFSLSFILQLFSSLLFFFFSLQNVIYSRHTLFKYLRLINKYGSEGLRRARKQFFFFNSFSGKRQRREITSHKTARERPPLSFRRPSMDAFPRRAGLAPPRFFLQIY